VKNKVGEIAKKLREAFGDLRVVDGCIPLRLQPMQCDVDGATPKDPTNCVYARAAKRQYGATKVIFWKTCAYADLVGKDGIRRVERFLIRRDVLDLIEKFDRGQPFEAGRAFDLIVPPYGSKIKVKARAEKERRRENKKHRAVIDRAHGAKRRVKVAEARLQQAVTKLQEVRTTEKPQSPSLKLAAEQVKNEKVAVRQAKNDAARLVKAADKIKKRDSSNYPGRNPQTFDLTVRNGLHHYNVVGVSV
jgi:hypothetical protein